VAAEQVLLAVELLELQILAAVVGLRIRVLAGQVVQV
jgi:hypothetical protein